MSGQARRSTDRLEPRSVLRLAYAAYNQSVAEAPAWRLPEAVAARSTDRRLLRQVVLTAEAAGFDYFFIPSILSSSTLEEIRGGNDPFRIDPIPLASFAAAITERIGLAVTVNTTYSHPFDVAREVASLDHLSGGRAAVNLVMGAAKSTAAPNYGTDPHPDTDAKYERAEEYLAVLRQLWHSWDRSWRVADPVSGILADPNAAHPIKHVGRHFQVAGTLTVPPPIQSRIPILHAGISARSSDFGARYADIRFASFRSLGQARAEYAATKARVADAGRDPRRHLVIPGLTIFTADTDAGARDRFRRVQDLAAPGGLPVALVERLGLDPAQVRPGDPVARWVAEADLADTESVVGRAVAAFGSDTITFADVAHMVATEARGQAHLVGGPTQIADWLEEAFHTEALDGIKLYPPYLPGPLDDFAMYVIPELRRRALVPQQPQEGPLIDRLGLTDEAAGSETQPSFRHGVAV